MQADPDEQLEVADITGADFSLRGERLPLLHVGDRAAVSWLEGQTVHMLACEVIHSEGHLRLRAGRIHESFAQMRDHERIPFRHRIACEPLECRVVREAFEVQGLEISAGGIGFSASVPLAPEDRILMHVPGQQTREAQVVRVSGSIAGWRQRVSARWL
jgi:hypothetical protein